jgi:hypothetical protein
MAYQTYLVEGEMAFQTVAGIGCYGVVDACLIQEVSDVIGQVIVGYVIVVYEMQFFVTYQNVEVVEVVVAKTD